MAGYIEFMVSNDVRALITVLLTYVASLAIIIIRT